MELDIVQIENALQNEKAEIDELDLKLRAIRSEKDNLRPSVQHYDALKKEEKATRKLRNAKYSVLKIHTEFIEGVTGEFPDGMFSLFAHENITKIKLDKAAQDAIANNCSCNKEEPSFEEKIGKALPR